MLQQRSANEVKPRDVTWWHNQHCTARLPLHWRIVEVTGGYLRPPEAAAAFETPRICRETSSQPHIYYLGRIWTLDTRATSLKLRAENFLDLVTQPALRIASFNAPSSLKGISNRAPKKEGRKREKRTSEEDTTSHLTTSAPHAHGLGRRRLRDASICIISKLSSEGAACTWSYLHL